MTSSNACLQNLRCPLTGSPLECIAPELLLRVQDKIITSGLFTRQGIRITGPLTQALINAEHSWIYPIVHGIPQMMIDEALAWDESEPKPVEPH